MSPYYNQPGALALSLAGQKQLTVWVQSAIWFDKNKKKIMKLFLGWVVSDINCGEKIQQVTSTIQRKKVTAIVELTYQSLVSPELHGALVSTHISFVLSLHKLSNTQKTSSRSCNCMEFMSFFCSYAVFSAGETL